MDIDRLPWESKVFVIQRKLRCHKRGIVSYTLWRKGLLGRSGGFFYSSLSYRNLQYKFEWKALHIKGTTPFISSLLYCKKPAGYNQLQFSWLNTLFTKAHDVSTKRPIGESQVFMLFSFVQKFAVQIWMTRIKWWKAGVNASFVLLALRKYLRAKECILW